MKIETKLNINDKCYVIHNDRIIKSKVVNIKIDVDIYGKPEIKYWIGNIGWFSEELVFTTKEQVLEFLEREIEEE